jgi:hypothetical protein
MFSEWVVAEPSIARLAMLRAAVTATATLTATVMTTTMIIAMVTPKR